MTGSVGSIDPLDYWSAFETWRAIVDRPLTDRDLFTVGDPTGKRAADVFSTLTRDSVPSYLELAADYGACGLWDKAFNVLSRYVQSAGDKKRANPLILYHLGY